MTNNPLRSAQPREQRYTPKQEVRVVNADGKRTISGYAAVFGQPSQDLGGFIEVIAPGAFTDSLSSANADILCLRDHDPAFLLGRTKSGTLSLVQDELGLRFTCDLPNTTQADDLIESIARGDLDGVSFGFVCLEDEWTRTTEGQVIRTLLKVSLFEVSPCSFPAYAATSVALRSCPPELRSLLSMQPNSNDGANNPAAVSPSELHRMQMRLALAQRR